MVQWFTLFAASCVCIKNAMKICCWNQMHGNDYDLFVSKQLFCCGDGDGDGVEHVCTP